MISFDEPNGGHVTAPVSNILQFGNTPQKPTPKSSQSSQNSTNFSIFGDALIDFPEASKTSEEPKDVTEKISELKEIIKKYEQEICNYKTSGNDFQIKFEKVKADLSNKTNICEKMEYEIIKVTTTFSF